MIARYLGKLALAVQVGATIAYICYMSEAALVLRVIQHCWYYSITDSFDRLATGLLPIFVAAHAIGHDKQAKWVRAGMIGACAMYIQDIILVRIIFAPDARV